MKKIALFLPFCFLLIACSNEAPNCSDPQTVSLIKQIVKDKLIQHRINTNNIWMTVSNIRTTNKNTKNGAYTCAADLMITKYSTKQSFPITYTSELLDNNKEFYVTVVGLEVIPHIL